MIIDAHQHAFWLGQDDQGLVENLDAHKIDLAWLLTWEIPVAENNPVYHGTLNPAHTRPDGTHPGIPLSDILLAHRRFPGRFVPGYCPDPRLPGAPDLFEAAVRIHGIRLCGEWKFRMLVDSPFCLQLFRKAGALGCPVTVHLDVPYRPAPDTGAPVYDPAWYGGTVDALARALDACPDTVFLGHAPGFWREISGDADRRPEPYPTGPVTPGGRIDALFERHPNLYGDLSAGSALNALSRDPAFAAGFLRRWSDRLLFARDNYSGDLRKFLESLDLPDDVKLKIYEGNARRLVPV